MIADTITRAIAVLNETVGKPYAPGAIGPDAYCCWGLVHYDQRAIFDRELPIVSINEASPIAVAHAVRNHPLFQDWPAVTGRPQHGDIVKMFCPEVPDHVGVFLNIDRGGIHHAVKRDGVRFDPLVLLPAMGWSRIVFHRPGPA